MANQNGAGVTNFNGLWAILWQGNYFHSIVLAQFFPAKVTLAYKRFTNFQSMISVPIQRVIWTNMVVQIAHRTFTKRHHLPFIIHNFLMKQKTPARSRGQNSRSGKR